MAARLRSLEQRLAQAIEQTNAEEERKTAELKQKAAQAPLPPPLKYTPTPGAPSSTSTFRTGPDGVDVKGIELENDQLLFSMLSHLSEERNYFNEQQIQLEVERFRETTTDKAIQRQLQNLQSEIREHQHKQEQQAQIDLMHEQQHARRCEKLKRMILDLESELKSEIASEQQYQEIKKRQQKESLETQKQWDAQISKIRERINKSKQPREKDREEKERVNSDKLKKIDNLYKTTVKQQNKNKIGSSSKSRSLPETSRSAVSHSAPRRETKTVEVRRTREHSKPKEDFDSNSPLAKAYEVLLPAFRLYGCVPVEPAC